jgi:hypothetical protein
MFGIVNTYSEQVNGKNMGGKGKEDTGRWHGSMSVSQHASLARVGTGREEGAIDLPESSGRPSSAMRL